MATTNSENPAMSGEVPRENVTPLDLAKKTLDDIYAKYADDPYLFSKIHNYVCWKLPSVIDEMKRANDERKVRNDILSTEQDAFIHSFLNANQYFYCSLTERFFFYDGQHYQLRREDDVLHHILTTITKEHNNLMPRKPQTKVYIMKRIKDSNPLKSTPESATIQSVLDSICPAFFSTKSAAKYFLTIVGDHLLKKIDETAHSYFASTKAKDFLRELGAVSQTLFGVNATAFFKHKYHYHAYKTIRLVRFGDTVGADTVWRSILNDCAVDLCCVAAYYSGRYESSDQYLEQYADEPELVRYALHFRGKLPIDVVDEFVKDYLCIGGASSGEPSSSSSSITTTAIVAEPDSRTVSIYTMEYLWRKYLRDRQFPSVLGSSTFINIIVERLPTANFDQERRHFIGVGSPHLLNIERFLRFWEECVVDDCPSDNPLDEYEIDEITVMYREWSGGAFRMTDYQMADLIRFYKKVDVLDNKYVQGIHCSLWNKQNELERFFSDLAGNINNCREAADQNVIDVGSNAVNNNALSFYDAYNAYKSKWKIDCRSSSSSSSASRLIISKPYFEKYIFTVYSNFVLDGGKLLSDGWWKTTRRTTI